MHNPAATIQPSAGHALLDSTALLAAISLMTRTPCLRQWSSILAGIKIFLSSNRKMASVQHHALMFAGLGIIVLLRM